MRYVVVSSLPWRLCDSDRAVLSRFVTDHPDGQWCSFQSVVVNSLWDHC